MVGYQRAEESLLEANSVLSEELFSAWAVTHLYPVYIVVGQLLRPAGGTGLSSQESSCAPVGRGTVHSILCVFSGEVFTSPRV